MVDGEAVSGRFSQPLAHGKRDRPPVFHFRIKLGPCFEQGCGSHASQYSRFVPNGHETRSLMIATWVWLARLEEPPGHYVVLASKLTPPPEDDLIEYAFAPVIVVVIDFDDVGTVRDDQGTGR